MLECGKSWAAIKNHKSFQARLQHRSQVQLKDRWNNILDIMSRNFEKQRGRPLSEKAIQLAMEVEEKVNSYP